MASIGLIFCILLIIGFLIYFLVIAANLYDQERTNNETLKTKVSMLEETVNNIDNHYHTELKPATQNVSDALVELCAIGKLPERQAKHLETAQHKLMEAHERLEKL